MRFALVTGAAGSIGIPLMARLHALGWTGHGVDIVDGTDVTKPLPAWMSEADVIFHLAGAKHAPEGELDPWETARTNIVGTKNVLDLGVRTILASTCKAADPETVYGASKLIAERMVLAAGGTVCRFYNVREASGNVFETWRQIPAHEPVPVTRCSRYFISLERAVDLLVWTLDQPPGRYTVEPPPPSTMVEEAERLGRAWTLVNRRRGDRMREPLRAHCEAAESAGEGFVRIICEHDAVREEVVA